MTSENSQNKPVELTNCKLNLEQTYEKLIPHKNTISFGRRCIVFCIATMVISAAVSLTMVVNKRIESNEKTLNSDKAYLANAKKLAESNSENALIWIGIKGYATTSEYQKIKALSETTKNPLIIEALIKSDETLKKNDVSFKGLGEDDIAALKAKAIRLGSVKFTEEKHVGNAK